MVVAVAALIVALSGSAVAITRSGEGPQKMLYRGAKGGKDLPKNSVGSKQLKADAVKAPDVANAAIGSQALIQNAVTQGHLASNSVTTNALVDAAINPSKLEAGAVTGEKIALAAVDGSRLAPDSVGADVLKKDSVGSLALQDNAVGTDALQSASIITEHLRNSIVDAQKFGSLPAVRGTGPATSVNSAPASDVAFGVPSFNAITLNTNGMAVAGSNDFFEVKTAGVYDLTGSVTWDDDGTTGNRLLGMRIERAGSGLIEDIAVSQQPTDGSTVMTQTVSTSAPLGVGDQISLLAVGHMAADGLDTSLVTDPGFVPPTLGATWVGPGG